MTKVCVGPSVQVSEFYTILHCDRLIESAGVHQLSTDGYRIYQVIVQNDPDSANSVHVGNDLQQTFQIVPGGALTIPIGSLTKVYVLFDGAATVNWIAMG